MDQLGVVRAVIVKTVVWSTGVNDTHDPVMDDPVVTLITDPVICERCSVVAPLVLALAMA